ncbi:lipoprotein LpqH [Mycobacterium sp. UM_CSW]|uniref:lipoprotein LpqH n=1 Tax=Mycobacterium sp. UM_CSW TaxID=1370119 RepID=UPI0004066EA0|nr:lipoprotein LpqH [Mycobacterium sp. UM_CSW]
MRNRWIAAVLVLIAGAGVAGCGQPQTVPRKAARVTVGGATQTTRPAACHQTQSYRTLDIADHDAHVEAVVMLSGYRAIPQWVKIRNFGGFTGSFWQGGVGDAHADLTNNAYTITGSAYGISSSDPNKTVTTDFKIIAEC